MRIDTGWFDWYGRSMGIIGKERYQRLVSVGYIFALKYRMFAVCRHVTEREMFCGLVLAGFSWQLFYEKETCHCDEREPGPEH